MAKSRGTPKGQKPKNYEQFQAKGLASRTPEERRMISQMGAEARKKKKEERMVLQNCMRSLLSMKTNSNQKKEVLKKFGFTDEELTNQSLLMVALFQKGLTGDVSAIKEITDMMEKLEMFEETGKVTSNNIVINLVPTGETYQPNETDEKEIWDAENGVDWLDEDEDEEDWGEDVYD